MQNHKFQLSTDRENGAFKMGSIPETTQIIWNWSWHALIRSIVKDEDWEIELPSSVWCSWLGVRTCETFFAVVFGEVPAEQKTSRVCQSSAFEFCGMHGPWKLLHQDTSNVARLLTKDACTHPNRHVRTGK